jgi:hypothetical protein
MQMLCARGVSIPMHSSLRHGVKCSEQNADNVVPHMLERSAIALFIGIEAIAQHLPTAQRDRNSGALSRAITQCSAVLRI